MRARPKVQVWLRPPVVLAEQDLLVDFALTSRSDTPVSGIDVSLRGGEYIGAPWGSSGTPVRQIVGLVSRHEAVQLTRGTHRFASRFRMPAGAPASYRGRFVAVSYELELWVKIPYWRDLRRRFVVPVGARGLAAAPSGALVFSSGANGPQPGQLYVEAALDSVHITPGGVLSGAVSLINVRAARVRSVDLRFVATERLPGYGTATEVRRYVLRLADGAPGEGESLRFNVRLPQDAPASFAATHFALRWELTITASTGFRDEVGVRVPIQVLPASTGAESVPQERARALAPVGNERRARIWASVASRLGLVLDESAERMSARVGQVSVAVEAELRGARGGFTVARLTWPALGLEAHVEHARWTDALSRGGIELGRGAFDRQFRVRGRERAQVAALLDEQACLALAGFAEVALDDRGAQLAMPGAGQLQAALEDAVARALAAARALDAAISRIPPPAAMAAHEPAWRAFAGRLGGRFEPGRMFVHEGTFRSERVAVGTLWTRADAPDATVIELALDPPLPARVDPLTEGDALPAAARPLARELATAGHALALGPDTLTLELDAPVADPSALEPLLEQCARLVRALRGRADAGPFR